MSSYTAEFCRWISMGHSSNRTNKQHQIACCCTLHAHLAFPVQTLSSCKAEAAGFKSVRLKNWKLWQSIGSKGHGIWHKQYLEYCATKLSYMSSETLKSLDQIVQNSVSGQCKPLHCVKVVYNGQSLDSPALTHLQSPELLLIQVQLQCDQHPPPEHIRINLRV